MTRPAFQACQVALASLSVVAGCSRPAPDAPSAPRQAEAAQASGAAAADPPREPLPQRGGGDSEQPQRPAGVSEPPPPAPTFVELLPGIRVDRERRMVEFDGRVPINVNDRDTLGEPLVVFLECVVTTPRAEKDHETLVVADIRPSNLHAALLAVGLEPGAPGDWRWANDQVERIAARGDEVVVTLRWEGPEGASVERDARELIVNEKTGEHFGGSAWVFAGSVEDETGGAEGGEGGAAAPMYAADATGLLVGLATFGTEVVAWREIISHEAEVDTPVWIADRRTTPAAGTRVTVRLGPGVQ